MIPNVKYFIVYDLIYDLSNMKKPMPETQNTGCFLNTLRREKQTRQQQKT